MLNNYLSKLLFLSLLASSVFAYSGGTGDSNSPYQIASVSDWNDLMHTSSDWNKHFVMTADVNLQGIPLTPVGNSTTNFTGVFDGSGRKIINFTINGGDSLGLFGWIYIPGSIKNLGLENFSVSGPSSYGVGGLAGINTGSISNCYSTGAVSGSTVIGGLVGDNSGSITNCYSTGEVSGSSTSQYVGGLVGGNSGNITNCYSTGTVAGTSKYVGGLVGDNYGSISNCYSTGDISGSQFVGGLMGANNSGSTNCYSTCTVSGSDLVGGLVGANNSGSITNCYSTGAASGSQRIGGLAGFNSGGITNCYSIGAVSGSSSVGGLVGVGSGAVNCFWDVNSSGWSTSAGGTGKTTTQMKTLSTFTSASWDFTTPLWKICDGTNYPKLSWQQSLTGDFVCPDGVDIYDLAVFTDNWLLEGSPYDLNGDGIVNFIDFALFAENWLKQI